MAEDERGPRRDAVSELGQALRTTDLVTPMAYLTRSLRSQDERSPQFAVALVRVLSQVGAGGTGGAPMPMPQN